MTSHTNHTNEQKPYLKMAVHCPLPQPLVYSSKITHPRGVSLWVPLGTRRAHGVVLGTTHEVHGDFVIKPVEEPHEDRPPLSEIFLQWLEWLSSYYLYPIGLVTELAFPPLPKKTRKKKIEKNSIIPSLPPSKPPTYTEEQQKCVEDISKNLHFRVHLLHGVTGSGKTEVYLNLLEKTLSQGKRGLVIVPEISLTMQLIERFSARFPEQIAVIHSNLRPREKTNQWWSMVIGDKKILIGARSALFCPIKDLGIIVLDEEHEPSFKQGKRFMYHARDAAIKRAQLTNCPIILGSATPSLETWKNAQDKKYSYHSMNSRVSQRPMPHIHVVDMRKKPTNDHQEYKEKNNIPFWMSVLLYQELTKTLEREEQVALFLNRRGIAPITLCSSCGYVYECPNCAISLTLHKKIDLVCHYCDYTQAFTEICPQCKSINVKPLGIGTEKIEKDLHKLFPKINITRADRDEIQDQESLAEMIKNMESGHTNILVGTQMIAKGLDFPKLTLVGLVMADVGFNLPDFRSYERSFQLFTQVSGRAGRHSETPGEVIIQTYNPQHPAITTANNYHAFVTDEMQQRQEMGYPPFGKLASIRVQGTNISKVVQICQVISYRKDKLVKRHPNYAPINFLGPAPAPISKIRNKFRYHFLVKSPHSHLLQQFCKQILGDQKWWPSSIHVLIEIDPINMI